MKKFILLVILFAFCKFDDAIACKKEESREKDLFWEMIPVDEEARSDDLLTVDGMSELNRRSQAYKKLKCSILGVTLSSITICSLFELAPSCRDYMSNRGNSKAFDAIFFITTFVNVLFLLKEWKDVYESYYEFQPPSQIEFDE